MAARDRNRPSAGRFLLRSWLLVGSAAVAVLAAEVGLEAWRPWRPLTLSHPYVNQYVRRELPRDLRVVTRPEGLPGFDGEGVFSTNGYGFRGGELQVPKPPDEYRIFLVGGSTTECFYVDDEDVLNAVIERELSEYAADGRMIRVYGAGVASAASDDHVAMIGQRLVHLEPDMIVVFSGINDLIQSICHVDPLHYTRPPPHVGHLWWRLCSHLRVAGLVERRILQGMQRVRRIQEDRGPIPTTARKAELLRSWPQSDEEPRTLPDVYERNLATVIGMARVHGFRLVFITQQSTWAGRIDPRVREWHHMRLRCGTAYSEEAMHAALERLNDSMRSLANEFGVPLWDLPAHLPKSLQYFYDDCHFNTNGSVTAGKAFAAFLRESRLVPTASEPVAEEVSPASSLQPR